MDTELRLLPSLTPPSPTITVADRLAAEISEAIDALGARIPHLESPHPSTASNVRGARTVSREFIESMIAAVEERPELQTIATFDADAAREMLQFTEAFRHVVDRLNMLVASVNYTMEARKARVAFAALRTYHIAKGLARDPDGAPLVPHLENLRRSLGRKAGRVISPATASAEPAV